MTTCRGQSRWDGEVACFTESSRYLIKYDFQMMPYETPPVSGPPRELRTDRRVRADLADASLPRLLICLAAFVPGGRSMAGDEASLEVMPRGNPARRIRKVHLLLLKSRQAMTNT